MVGLSLALLLGATLPAGRRICLVESVRVPEGRVGSLQDYHPSFDARSTALSYSSRLVYRRAGLWPTLSEWLCPIETIHVSMKGRFGSTLMSARDCHWPALGYVVENAWLGRALLSAVREQGRVEVLSPARVTRVEPAGRGVRLTLDSEAMTTLDAALLVVADGAGSALRASLGVEVSEKPYGQHALIANIASAEPHRGCAFERFTADGPLALLPLLPSRDASCRSALVWTLTPERAEALAGCGEDEFLRELQQWFGYRLGRLLRVGERHSYPLALMRAEEQVRQGVVVMGNAAHALHPVAGQGFNLALRDADRLAGLLLEACSDGTAPGDLALLQRYVASQQSDQDRTIGASDLLPSLFMHDNPALGVARDAALSGLDFLPPLKRQFVNYAAGVGGAGE